jgi:hypothetical protein
MTNNDTAEAADTAQNTANAARSSKQSQYQTEVHAIRRYLQALEGRSSSPFQGKRTREWVIEQISTLPDAILAETDPVKKLLMTQDLLNHQKLLRNMPTDEEFAKLEDAFVRVAKAWSDRKGVSWAAWRHVRVDEDVLARAGIKRTG